MAYQVKQIRMDFSSMAIKAKTKGKYGGNGWKFLENDFKSKAEMIRRYNELIGSEYYEEG